MCDRETIDEWAATALSRRELAALGAAGAVAACTPTVGEASRTTASSAVAERAVSFATPDGTLDGEFFARAAGKAPGVVLWPDIAGIRPAKRQMARRLAQAGFAVLLANPYYRDVKGQQFADFADFAANGGWGKVTPWRSRFTYDTVTRDTAAVAGWLARQAEVDTRRGMGAQGYCMTGSFALLAPAAAPAMRAGASFHGGGLVRGEDPTSPHRKLIRGKHYLVAIARNDDAKSPGDKDALRAAASDAGSDAEIEVYPADHGWCVPDSPSYDQVEADRAWTRLLALYAKL